MERLRNRDDAGERLSRLLAPFFEVSRADAPPVVLGLPRGGVPVAAGIARRLGLPLDVIVVRKLGAPAHGVSRGATCPAARGAHRDRCRRRHRDHALAAVIPDALHSVGEWYEDFAQTPDDEVVRLLTLGLGDS